MPRRSTSKVSIPGANAERNRKARARKAAARTEAWQRAQADAKRILAKEGDKSAPLDDFVSKVYHRNKRRKPRKE